MRSSLGLIELLLVLLGVLGWGAYELWSLRRGRAKPVARPRPDDPSRR